jgi:hypothetical protein
VLFVERIREEPELLVKALGEGGYLSSKKNVNSVLKRLCVTIMASLFRSCFTLNEEYLFLRFVEVILSFKPTRFSLFSFILLETY